MAQTATNSQSRLEGFISTSLSTQILIEVDNKKVGAIQNMKIDQRRTNERVGEVGFDGTLELVPNQRTNVTLTIDRIVFDGVSLPIAFGRPFHNIKSQRIPFNIRVYDNMYAQAGEAPGFAPVDNSPGMVIHEYKNCWFNSLSTSYEQGKYIISQNAGVDVEDVVTYFANGTTRPALPDAGFFGGYEGVGPDGNLAFSIETTTDVGRRGSMDAAGLGLLFNDIPIFRST